MWWRRRCHRPIGLYIIFAGIGVILALILPPVFWWFFFGAALIVVGLALLRGC